MRNEGLLSVRVMPTPGAGAGTAPALSRRPRRGWRGACALSHDSNRQQARAVETATLALADEMRRLSRGTLRRARPALGPRPALRVPARAASRRDASTPTAMRRHTSKEQPIQPQDAVARASEHRIAVRIGAGLRGVVPAIDLDHEPLRRR